MKKIYITGVSGTGKSTIAEELNKRGIYTIDIDNDLCHWKNKETKEKVNFEYGIGRDWLKAHGWYCDIEKLKKLIDIPKDVYIFGIATNQDEFLPLFDKIFVLHCSEKVLLDRVHNRKGNDFGKHPSEKEYILSFFEKFKKDLINKGAIPINTEDSIENVINNIISP